MIPEFLPWQPLFAQHPPFSPGEMVAILLFLFGPFILSGLALVAAIGLWPRHRPAAGICLGLAVILSLLGCVLWWFA